MKQPFLSKETLQAIVKEYPTPFHIYDERGIRENLRKLQDAFSWNPGFKEYFAVKALPNPYILNLLREEGCGADCSSYTELLMAKAAGFQKDEIMFSSNVTPREDMLLAHELGALINFDDITHIDFAAGLFALPEAMSCRYNPGGVFQIANHIMDNPSQSKYGFTPEQMEEGFLKMRRLGVREFGIHAFLASNTQTDDYYPALAEILFGKAVELSRKTGARIRFLNLSGGIGIPYLPGGRPVDIRLVGERVREAYDRILTKNGMGDVAIYTELGRYITGPYGALVATAIHKKSTYKEYIGLDACAANLMRPAMYGAYHHITVMGKENDPCTFRYDVTGGLCENNDKFAVDRMLPEIGIGDLLYIHDTGAHGFAMGYNYNGKLRSAELLYRQDGTVRLIRRAETPRDYFRVFDFSEEYGKMGDSE